jgi:hypothetical protein
MNQLIAAILDAIASAPPSIAAELRAILKDVEAKQAAQKHRLH